MTVFDVFLNGRKVCRAGIGDEGVLTALVSWSHVRPAQERAGRTRARIETQLQVGGLAKHSHRTWVGRRLNTGDRVTVSVVNADTFDRPARLESSDPARRERQEKRYYERLRQKYEPAESSTRFLNVDLDIWSKTPLERLVHAFGRQVIVLRAGKENGRHGAHLEHGRSASGRDVDRAIQRLVRAVEKLPPRARTVWNRAERRDFNVGIQGGMTAQAF